jgi:hypothetical protein
MLPLPRTRSFSAARWPPSKRSPSSASWAVAVFTSAPSTERHASPSGGWKIPTFS